MPLLQPGTLTLVTTDDWFQAPDGTFKAAWGPCTVIKAEDLLGFKPAQSTNWFLQVGYPPNSVLIAGCRIHYAMPMEKMPTQKDIFIGSQ
jgi:hypothetical protein